MVSTEEGQGNSQNVSNTDSDSRPPYTMHGILHFLQHEWSRYELDRARWEAERAEMQARISFLQGERKGQENLKVDLVRRIKMLEYCLKQERAKYYRAVNGVDMPTYEDDSENTAPSDTNGPIDFEAYTNDAMGSGSWKQGRQLLKKYLEEIGFSEQILDVRSFRVKNLLGLIAPADLPSNDRSNSKKDRSDSDSDNEGGEPLDAAATEALDEFAFLDEGAGGVAGVPVGEIKDWSKSNDGTYDRLVAKYKNDQRVKRKSGSSEEGSDTNNDADTTKKNSEDDYLPPGLAAAKEAAETVDAPRRSGRRSANFAFGAGGGAAIDKALGITPDIDIKDEFNDEDDPSTRPTKWSLKTTLRSHLDSIRAMQFHPVELVLFTASEDGTAKLWNLEQKKEEKHGAGAGELEPVYTFRGHMGAVLCLDLSPTGDHLYTGGVDGVICCWNVPSTKCDPYEAYDAKVLAERLRGHTDAVWSVVYNSSTNRLVSASADSTIRLWEPGNGADVLVRTIEAPKPGLLPTSVDFVSTETSQLLAAYTNCFAQIVDVETGNVIMVFDFGADATPGAKLTRIVSHPTMPISVVGADDRKIRYFDNATGNLIHSSVVHVEGVSSLAIDPNGLYLLSGSHDGSLRLWNMEKKVCLQEISAHRKKYDAAVTSVAFHPSRAMIGSSGADSLAKVYVSGEQ